MKQYGIGIIGSGWVAGEHVRAFAKHAQCEVRGVSGRDLDRTKAFVQQQVPGAKPYTDFEEMLAEPGIDIIAIATPPDVHCEQAVAAAAAGKHLLLEKAMATTLEESLTIRNAVEAAGVKSVVSFVLRWNPLFEIIKAQLADNTIGDVYLGEVDYYHGIGPWYKQFAWNVKKDVGVSSLLSAGCHAMDAMRWFMGGEVVEVFQYSTAGGGKDFTAYEYAPTTCTMCKFADGRIGKVTSCIEAVQPYVFNINLVGVHGAIRNNQFYSKTKYPGQTTWAQVPTILPDSGDVSHHPFTHEVEHLIQCIEGDVESHCNVADAYKTHAICFAADQSGVEGVPVKLPQA
jgi:predicted dehydrogenase